MGVPPQLFVLEVMDTGRNPEWEEERHVPVRSCGVEDGEGAAGPSTSKGEMESVRQKMTNKLIFFAIARWAGRHAERRVASPWQRRECIFLCRIMLAKCKNPRRFP